MIKALPDSCGRFTAAAATLVGALAAAPAAHAHTSSVGYENAGPGSVTFWYGTYHSGTSFTEGSLQVTGPDGYSSTVAFSLLASTKPSGLVDGTTNFYSDGSQLVGTYGGTIYAWQGSTFTDLKAGSYTFTYIPISTPTAVWDPIDAIILSSSVTLDETIIGSTPDPLFVENANTRSQGAAAVLDSLNGNSSGGMSVAIDVLSSLSGADQAAALQRIAPVSSHAAASAATTTLTGALDTVQIRMDGIRDQGFRSAWARDLKAGRIMVATVGDLATLFPSDEKRHAVWAKAFGSRSEQDMDGGYAGYEADSSGAAFGADTQLDNEWVVGAAVSYADTDLDLQDFRTGDGSDIKSYQLTGYASRDFGRWYLDSMIAFARHGYDSVRSTGIAGVASADFDADQYGARVTAGLPIDVHGKFTVTPMAGVEAMRLEQDGYTEQGGGAVALQVASQTSNRVRSMVGAKVETELALRDGMRVIPSLHAAWRHDFKDDGVDTTATFTGGGAAFTTPGQDISRNRYNVGASLTFRKSDRLSFAVRVDGEWGSDYSAAAGQVVGQWRF